MCGANGWSRIRKSRRTETGLVSQVIASLMKTIRAEMAVLKRRPSRSSVTFLMQAWSALSWAAVGCDVLDAGSEPDAAQQLRAALRVGGQALLELGFALLVHEQAPDAAEKAIDALDTLGAPRLHHLQRAHEHLVKAERVGAVLDENVVGVDHVAARLGHLLAVFAEDQALVDELEERLRGGDVAQVEEHLVPEPGVEQMQHGVFGAADVEIDARRGCSRRRQSAHCCRLSRSARTRRPRLPIQ